MDKKKSGKLIRECRIQKNYTQSELGDLVGVSNKAVSRWENGESFPDVGVLENLASILDVNIQDIITGEKEEKERKDDSVVTEIVRVASLQKKERKRNLVSIIFFTIVLIFCAVSGYSAMGNKGYILVNDSIISYIILMVISYFLIFYIWMSGDNIINYNNNKLEKSMKIVALVLFVLTLIIGFEEIFIISKGLIPFGMEKSKVGPFINGQLISLFAVNIIWFISSIYMYEKKLLSIHFWWLLSIASMYVLVLYGDLLHRMASTQGFVNSLILRSFIVYMILGLSLLFAYIKNKIRGNSLSEQGN